MEQLCLVETVKNRLELRSTEGEIGVNMQTTKIAGYTYGTKAVSKSPVSLEELERLKQTVTLSDTDVRHLRLAGDVLEDQTEEVINAWRGIIGNTPHLARYFTAPNGNPDENYKARAKERFKQWILDVCRRPYDQDWLDYQHEIGLRHTHLKKNRRTGPPRRRRFRSVM